MRSRFTIILATVLALVGLMAMPAAAQDKAVVQRDLGDAFVDTFFLEDVALIRAQMPFNTADPVTSLIAGMRVDNIDAVAAGGPCATLEEMLQVFYDNQVAFNDDPGRNRIEMHGTVKEVTQEDGTVLVMANIVYTNLPLSLYELDSWDNALWEEFDPAQAVKVLEDGYMNARVYVEMEIPSPGAPLHFWDSYFSGGLRQLTFVGHGEGWLVDENGQRTGRAMVDINDAAETFRITLVGVPASQN